MKRDAKTLLWDAREAASAIAAMTAGKSFADFDSDIVLRSAVERQFEIAGEALGRLARRDATLAAKAPICARSWPSATSSSTATH